MTIVPGKIFTFVIACGLLSVAQSCNIKKDRITEIKTLDSLEQILSNAGINLHKLRADSTDARIDTINVHLQYVQSNFVGKMKVPMALALDNYASMKNNLSKSNINVMDFQKECNTSIGQLKDLRQALSENATHDAAENLITDGYVKERLSKEASHAEELGKRMEAAQVKYDSIQRDYEEKYLEVKNWVDSIPEKKLKK